MVLGGCRKSGCLVRVVLFGTVRITDLDFADGAVIFLAESGVPAETLESLSEEAVPLGLRVS